TAPNADQEIQRQQHQLIKDVKQEEIQGTKNAHDCHIEDHQQDKITFDAFLDVPGGTDSNDHDQCRQKQKRHGKSVDADKIIDFQLSETTKIQAYPGRTVDELI